MNSQGNKRPWDRQQPGKSPSLSGYRVALAGNPNTGKSTLFNALTGMRQHTGNWPGKTVLHAEGRYLHNGETYTVIDLPGTYSLFSNSADEEVARDHIVFDQPDVTVVVLDATALERNLNLALQVLEMSDHVVLCVNLMDEAKRKGIQINSGKLSDKLGVPVIKTAAREGEGLEELKQVIARMAQGKITTRPYRLRYDEKLETKIAELEPEVRRVFGNRLPSRWIALRLLDGDAGLAKALRNRLGKEEVDQSGTTDGSPYPVEA
ncbi:iron transporter FeoB [Kroppenstedtia guangzhouensis]|uniref:Iron transporter FeoB n=1 Tax=Kroppenstedtia guangzhouensis TaxID=1274356 RepID=A0ABQ1GBG0_9BACL|nr:FeoB small GTPase domain-containing protein [Kroppenstedtia guangzhouensis]GGA40414.1 iron transporter FeoB [Kroppenstedtia guangzhouensis]